MSDETTPGIDPEELESGDDEGTDVPLDRKEEREARRAEREEEQREYIENEDDLLEQMLGMAEERAGVSEVIDVVTREGRAIYFRIAPVSEADESRIRKSCTTFKRRRRMGGMSTPEELNTERYRSLLIVAATQTFCAPSEWDDDGKAIGFRDLGVNMWKNRALRERLKVADNAAVVDALLLPGQKEEILERVDRISGYDEDEDAPTPVDVAKN